MILDYLKQGRDKGINIVWFYLPEVVGAAKFIEAESRMAVSRGSGDRKWGVIPCGDMV